MFKFTTTLGVLAASACVASAATAATYTFDFSNLNGSTSGAYSTTVGDLTITVTAGSFVNGFNGSSSYYRQDADGNNVRGRDVLASNTYASSPRVTADSPDGLGVRNSPGENNQTDGSGWDDFLVFSFSSDVQLDSAAFGNFNAGFPGYDDFRLIYDTSGDGSIGSGDFVTGNYDDNPFTSFPSVTDNVYAFLATGSNDDWRLRELTVSTVPLPAGGLMLLTGLAGIAAARRRKKS